MLWDNKAPLYLILGGEDGRTPVAVDAERWSSWFGEADRSIGKTEVGDLFVSTVFIGVAGTLFETMIIGEKGEEYCTRSDTWEDAELEHAKAVMSLHLKKEPTDER